MGLRQVGRQREGRLLRVTAGVLLKHSDGIIPTGCSQSPCQLTPGKNMPLLHVLVAPLPPTGSQVEGADLTDPGLLSSQTSGLS